MGKTMYELVDWPDIQEFMEDDDYEDRVYFDPETLQRRAKEDGKMRAWIIR